MSRLHEIEEPVGVHTLGTEYVVEAFHEGIVNRLARSREVDLRCVLVRPWIPGLTGNFASVVTEQHLGHTTVVLQPV